VSVARTLYVRLLHTPEGVLMLSAEAVWAMIGFASVAMALVSGGIVAAWNARTTPADNAWDRIEMDWLQREDG
jgi:hypothetical protein